MTHSWAYTKKILKELEKCHDKKAMIVCSLGIGNARFLHDLSKSRESMPVYNMCHLVISDNFFKKLPFVRARV